MGFLERAFLPEGVRRAMNPVGALKGALTPDPIKRARRDINRATDPVGAVQHEAEGRAADAVRRKTLGE